MCSFVQDIKGLATELPRLPSEVKAVKMIRTWSDKTGVESTKTYMINKKRVMDALNWLKIHNIEYKKALNDGTLSINEQNLDWMEGKDEAELPNIITVNTVAQEGEGERDFDRGPAEKQCLHPMEENNNEWESSGIMTEEETPLVGAKDESIINSLKEADMENKMPKVLTMRWPQQETVPISEYREKVFCNAFPWLFPGGIGDINEGTRENSIDIGSWASNLLYYEDG